MSIQTIDIQTDVSVRDDMHELKKSKKHNNNFIDTEHEHTARETKHTEKWGERKKNTAKKIQRFLHFQH